MKTSYIYLISNGKDIKVGVSINPWKRLKQLQTGNPETLTLVGLYQVPAAKVFTLEKEAHRTIQRSYIKQGEWFKGASSFHLNLIVDEICANDLVPITTIAHLDLEQK